MESLHQLEQHSSSAGPQDSRERSLPHVRRVGLIDRVALHVGVALIAWGRRPRLVESHERRANRLEQHLAVLGRELAAERTRSLSSPQR